MKSDQVTIKDLARMLNISAATVSRALKNHPDISKSTKKAVLELAKEMNYHPNSIASSLRNQKTMTIGVVVPEIVHYFFASVISGIEDIAYEAGYHVMVCQSNESYEREVVNIDALISHRVDGILASISKETTDFAHFHKVMDRGIPLVFFDRIPAELQTHSVSVDDTEGAFQAVNHLLAIGRKRIAHLAGPTTLNISKDRRNGYLKALRLAGIPPEERLCPVADDRNSGYTTTKQLLSLGNPPDAIFAVNDNSAVGALQACTSMGIRVPEEVAIVGFSDDRQITSLTDPPLSSVYQPSFEIGQTAGEILLKQLKSPKEKIKPIHKTLNTKLVTRESSVKQVVNAPKLAAR